MPHIYLFICRIIGAKEIELSTLSGLDDPIPFLMDDVKCSGNEVRLIDCDHETIHNCFSTSEQVAVHCKRNG